MSVELEEKSAAARRTGSTPSRGTSRSSSSVRARGRSATRCRRSTCRESIAIPRASAASEIAGETEITEVEVARHFTRLSRLNFSIDQALYPLGSCTMKHNPRINEEVARLPGFAAAHPLAPGGGLAGSARARVAAREDPRGADGPRARHAAALGRRPGRARRDPDGPRGAREGGQSRARPCSSRTRRTARTRPRRTSPATRSGSSSPTPAARSTSTCSRRR